MMLRKSFFMFPMALRCTLLLILITGSVFKASFAAEPWPNRPVIIVNPWAAGGPAEGIIRPIADKLSSKFGQPFIIDTKSGANGTIGAAFVARAKPDGHTLLFAHVGPIAISPALSPKPPYDSLRDFVPIVQISSSPTVLVVRSDFPAKTLNELISYSKVNPGKVAYGSVGIGSSTHLAGATLAQSAKIEMIHVPYRGSSLINTDLLGGQIQTAFVGVAGVKGLIKDGRLRALAVSESNRSDILPDVPTVAETIPGFQMTTWYGLMAPAGTSPDIVSKLQSEVALILKNPEIASRMRDNGLVPEGSTSQSFAELIKGDLSRWSAAVKAADIKD
jgi:tripartite-type tricarboxylate transporter receptor subunit TctC